jgi:hypothetical protein
MNAPALNSNTLFFSRWDSAPLLTLFTFLIQHSSEKHVRTHRITKMYMYTKCKFKNMSKNVTYDSYRPIISNYYNLDLTSDLHRDSLSHDRDCLTVTVCRFSFPFSIHRCGIVSIQLKRLCYGVRGYLDHNPTQTRTPIQTQTQNPKPMNP